MPLNPRIYHWDRFRQIAGAFRQTFGDHPTQVKHRSTLVSFEMRHSILEWEWRVIQSMFMDSDEIPAPQCEKCLCVYLHIFEGHADHDALVRMRDHRTPLDVAVTWGGAPLWDLSPVCIQRRNQAFERRHLEVKQSIRAWNKRWKYKSVEWKSRNRSAVCRDLRDALLQSAAPGPGPRIELREWIQTHPVGDHPELIRVEDGIRASGV